MRYGELVINRRMDVVGLHLLCYQKMVNEQVSKVSLGMDVLEWPRRISSWALLLSVSQSIVSLRTRFWSSTSRPFLFQFSRTKVFVQVLPLKLLLYLYLPQHSIIHSITSEGILKILRHSGTSRTRMFYARGSEVLGVSRRITHMQLTSANLCNSPCQFQTPVLILMLRGFEVNSLGSC